MALVRTTEQEGTNPHAVASDPQGDDGSPGQGAPRPGWDEFQRGSSHCGACYPAFVIRGSCAGLSRMESRRDVSRAGTCQPCPAVPPCHLAGNDTDCELATTFLLPSAHQVSAEEGQAKSEVKGGEGQRAVLSQTLNRQATL